MSFGRNSRNKYLVLVSLLIWISLLFFIYQQKLNYVESSKSNILHLQHLKAINKDMKDTYQRFEFYKRFIEKMANELRQSKEKIAKESKEYRINKGTSVECTTPPFLLIEIHSHPKNFLSRQAIRLSWGNKDLNQKR